jgi:hypothetical protein
MLAAGFGDTRFFTAEANHFPKGSPYYSRPAVTSTTSATPPRPRTLAAKAGYKGEPIRVLASRQYDFHYNMALVMAEQLKRAGFKAELNVVDWATLVQRRNDSQAVGRLHHAFGPVPRADAVAAAAGRRRTGLVGFTPPRRPRCSPSTSESDPAKRGALWGKVQQVVYDEVPYIEVGKFNACRRSQPSWRTTSPRSGRSSGTSPRTERAVFEVTGSECPCLRSRFLLPGLRQAPERALGGGKRLVVLAIVFKRCWWPFVLTRAASGDPVALLLGDQATPPTSPACACNTAWTSRSRCSSATGCASCCRATWAPRSFCSGRWRRRCGSVPSRPPCSRCWPWPSPRLIGVPCGMSGRVPRALRRPVVHRPGDAGRQHPELLAGPGADPDLRRVTGLVPGVGLWRTRRPLAERLHTWCCRPPCWAC